MEKYSIKEVLDSQTLKDFIEFPYTLYKHHNYWIPPIKSDEKKYWTEHPALEFSDMKKWVVYWKNRPVGRIAAIINPKYNGKTGEKYGRISGLETYNDEKSFRLMMDTALKWLKQKGMEKVHGPLGFTNLDTQGMLIEGFEELPSIASVYHMPYYKTLMQKYGFKKEKDWIEFHLILEDELIQKGDRVVQMIKKRYGLEVFSPENKKELEKYAELTFEILNKSFKHLPYVIEFDDKLKTFYKKKYFSVLDPKYTFFVRDKEGNIVGFLITIPSLSKAMQKVKGSLWPFGWYYLWKAFKKPGGVDTLISGVIPEYESQGVAVLLFDALHHFMKNNHIRDIETTGVFEDNLQVINNWQNYKHKQHKRRRSWVKDL